MRIEHQHNIDNYYKESSFAERSVESISAIRAPRENAHHAPMAELSDSEKKQVEELKKIDRRVRQHEMAHLAAGSGIVRSGTQFSFKTGPDGKQYAVAGEVEIDTSAVPDNPKATVRKAQQIKNAALAPVDPSTQDRKVAAQATQMEQKARQQLNRQKSNADSGYQADGRKLNLFKDVFAIRVKF